MSADRGEEVEGGAGVGAGAEGKELGELLSEYICATKDYYVFGS